MLVVRLQRLFIAVACSFIFYTTGAQPATSASANTVKPYKVQTSGKQITIRSTRSISHVMLWTIGGNRVVEQKDINTVTYTFTVPVNQKGFYLMIGMSDGKIYTEKIGVR